MLRHEYKQKLIDVVALSKRRCPFPIKSHLKYSTTKNFTGQMIIGYSQDANDFALLTKNAEEALCLVQNCLIDNYGYGLNIYDALHPEKAVNHFIMWAKQPAKNQHELDRKAKHYPNIEKSQLFALKYIAKDSGHCYGNTVDLILIDVNTGNKVNMGGRFDLMDTTSHITATKKQIGAEAFNNRTILLYAMKKFEFEPYQEEFWHFSHRGLKGREIKEAVDINISSELSCLNLPK